MLQTADLFVLSSSREGLPNVVLQARPLKAPVISTRIPGTPRLSANNGHRFVVDTGEQMQAKTPIEQHLEIGKRRSGLTAKARQRIAREVSFRTR